MPDDPDPIKDAFNEAFHEAQQQNANGMPFGLPPMFFLSPVQAAPPPAMKPPLSRTAAERIWDKVQACRRVSTTSMTTFAACTGYMPTLQAPQVIKGKHGDGWLPERWTLEDAPDHLGKHDLAFFYERPPEVLPRVFHDCLGSGSPIILPCAVCGVYFEPGEYVRTVPVLTYAKHGQPPAQPCGAPGCVCHHGPTEPDRHLSTVAFHAHHLFEDESHYVPLPTPEQAREQQARARKHAAMKKHWLYRWSYLAVRLLDWTLEYGANKGWWPTTHCDTI